MADAGGAAALGRRSAVGSETALAVAVATVAQQQQKQQQQASSSSSNLVRTGRSMERRHSVRNGVKIM